MGYTVSVNHPHFPEGQEFGVGTFGSIPNGSSKEISEEEERLFVMRRGLSVEEAFAGDAAIKITGSSALDKSELESMKEFFNPQATPVEESKPAWLTSSNEEEEEEGEVNG